jgi:hypothetical protein
MQCEKHPSYKGKTPTKRNCPTCQQIFQEQEQIRQKNKRITEAKKRIDRSSVKNKYGDYLSLTTPKFACRLFHVLCEISCMMMFGNNLPPYFWRKNSSVPQKIKDYYQKKFTALIQMKKRNPDIFREIEGTFWIICAKDLLNKAIQEERAKLDLHSIESQKNEPSDHSSVVSIPNREVKKDFWDLLGE